MFAKLRCWPVLLTLHLSAGLVLGQNPPAGEKIPPPIPPPTPAAETPPAKDAVAAVVNGQPVPELSVFRSLLRVHPQHRDKARAEVLNYLIDNVIIDQYLAQLKIEVSAKDLDENIGKIKAEAKKAGRDFDAMLKGLYLTEDDLRRELVGALRWDKFVAQQGTDKVLRDMFTRSPDMFNGALMRTRHILVKVPPASKAEAETKIVAFKKQVEAEVAQEIAELPPAKDKIVQDKERAKALERIFANLAAKESACPSGKQSGGDLGEFPRVGAMVEPFARAAFALKPYQLSDPVVTEFGVHLILAIDYKPGKDVKFEDPEIRQRVANVYAERLREAVLNSYKPKSKIEIQEKQK